MAVEERPGAASLRGNPFTVLGRELRPGDDAPDFSLVGPGMFEVTLEDSAGKVRLISCVPSLDTAVCSTETQKWEPNRHAMGDVEMLTISMDLPYAQQRWCAANGVQHTTASAHKNEQFGIDYGVLIKELRILARAVFVIDREDKVRYVEYVKDFSNEPNYQRAIAAVRQAANRG
jgi:thiol peroxidase